MSYPILLHKPDTVSLTSVLAIFLLICQLTGCSTPQRKPEPLEEQVQSEPEPTSAHEDMIKQQELMDSREATESAVRLKQSSEKPRSERAKSERAKTEAPYSSKATAPDDEPDPSQTMHKPSRSQTRSQQEKDDAFMSEQYATDKPDQKKAAQNDVAGSSASEETDEQAIEKNRSASHDSDKQKQMPELSATGDPEQAEEKQPALGKQNSSGKNSLNDQPPENGLSSSEQGNVTDDQTDADNSLHIHGYEGTHENGGTGDIYPSRKTRYWNMQRPQTSAGD